MNNSLKSPLDSLLEEIPPLEQAKTNAKMMLAARIADAMQTKNWRKIDLLAAVNKGNPSVITQWLSGTHNFTVDTLVELENALGISLLNLEVKKKQAVIVYHLSKKIEVMNEAPQLLRFNDLSPVSVMGKKKGPCISKSISTPYEMAS